MSIVFDTANKDDIEELIRLRIAYMVDDFGSVMLTFPRVLKNVRFAVR